MDKKCVDCVTHFIKFISFALVGLFFTGRKAYSLTWGLQYANLFMINTGYIILAGQALKVNSRTGIKFSTQIVICLLKLQSSSFFLLFCLHYNHWTI